MYVRYLYVKLPLDYNPVVKHGNGKPFELEVFMGNSYDFLHRNTIFHLVMNINETHQFWCSYFGVHQKYRVTHGHMVCE
jgi:hypothetical protein